MKTILAFVFLFGMHGFLRGQEELIVIRPEPVGFKAEGFYIDKVTDGRFDKDSIGFIQKDYSKRIKYGQNSKMVWKMQFTTI